MAADSKWRHFGYDDGSDDGGGGGGLHLQANSGTNEMSLQESKDKASNKTYKNIVNKAKKPYPPPPVIYSYPYPPVSP